MDQSALMAAYACGIPTGGNIPWQYKTLDGYRFDLGFLGLKVNDSPQYPPRTELNVLESDGTLRLAQDYNSAGEKCTYRYLIRHRKPYYDVKYHSYLGTFNRNEISIIKTWIITKKIRILNLAGNSEETSPGITSKAFFFLYDLFKICV